MRLQSGPNPEKKKKDKYEIIIALRKQKLSITKIGKLLNMSKQGVAYYLNKYGDIDTREK